MNRVDEEIQNQMDEVSSNKSTDTVNSDVNEMQQRRGKIRKKKIKDYSKKGKKCNIILYITGIIIFLAALALVGFCMYKLYKLDMLPVHYFKLIIAGLGIFELITAIVILFRRSHIVARIIFLVLAICVGAVCGIGGKYLTKTNDFLDNVVTDNISLKTFYVLVKADAKYEKIEDLKNASMYYFNDELVDDAPMLDAVLDKVELEIYAKESNDELGKALMDGEVDAIVLEASAKTLLEDSIEGFTTAVKQLYTFELEEQTEDIAKEVESISTTPFVVYIGGVDTWGSISSVSRNDVNMVAAVNPATHQVLLVSIPRDYYVQLNGTRGLKDKLTHAGIYGINKSVKTVEDLLHTDINYYVRVNFTSLVEIVNALGGITVYSKEAFKTTYGNLNISFKQGYNDLNGWEALAFCRERKDFKLGDRMRGVNQAAVLSAIIKKACSYSVVTKFEELLAAVEGKFTTNMSVDTMRDLVKSQLTSMQEWTVTSLALNGKDARAYTYAMGTNNLLYVMLPDDSQIQNAINKIDAVLDGEILDGTLGEIKTPVVSQKYYDEIQAMIDKKAKEEAEKKAQEEAAKKEEEENKQEQEGEQGESQLPEGGQNPGNTEDGTTDTQPTTPPTTEGGEGNTETEGGSNSGDESGNDTGNDNTTQEPGEGTTPPPAGDDTTTGGGDSSEGESNNTSNDNTTSSGDSSLDSNDTQTPEPSQPDNNESSEGTQTEGENN